MKTKTPELNRIADLQEKSQAIGDFLEWLRNEKSYMLATWSKDMDYESELLTVHDDTETLIAEYFKIDLKKAEQERRALLEEVRGQNGLDKDGEEKL